MLYLEEVNRYPLIPPNVDSATEIGITQENIPSSFSPNVWKNTTSDGSDYSIIHRDGFIDSFLQSCVHLRQYYKACVIKTEYNHLVSLMVSLLI